MFTVVSAQSNASVDAVTTACTLLIAVLVGVVWWLRTRIVEMKRRVAELERVIASAKGGGGAADDGQRNQILFDQHRQLNGLQIAKLTADLEMVRAESRKHVLTAAEEKDRFEAAKEFHELMVEKSRLEIESLRLHIRELRKRMEDWSGGEGA